MLMEEQSHPSCAPGAYVGQPRARVGDLLTGRFSDYAMPKASDIRRR